MGYILHKANERGSTKFKWLESFHSFSFGRYINPKRTGFGRLVVFNDDIIAPGKGFSTHPHDNMEIITIVTEGTLEHKASMGTGSQIRAGEIQVMTAGTGITHSETNPSTTEVVHLFQIWIEPRQYGLKPRYQQKKIEEELFKNRSYSIVTGTEDKDTLSINQDAELYRADLEKGTSIDYELQKGRGLFLFNIEGQLQVNELILSPHDSIEITNSPKISITALTSAKLILIEVPLQN